MTPGGVAPLVNGQAGQFFSHIGVGNAAATSTVPLVRAF